MNGWKLKIIQLKRNIIFQTSIFGFHVNLRACKNTAKRNNAPLQTHFRSDQTPCDVPLYWLLNRDPYHGLFYNIYRSGWHNPQCLYIIYIYSEVVYITQPTRTSSSSKGSLSDTNPNFIHPYPKEIPSNLTIHVLLV